MCAVSSHLCSKLELVQSLADLIQVVVLLLCLSIKLRGLLAIANVSQAPCADTLVCAAARLDAIALLLLLLPAMLLLHGLRVGCHARVIAGTTTARTHTPQQ